MGKISNERLCAALMASPTVRAAAANAGVSERLVYDRMNHDDEFKALYAQAQTEILREAVHGLQNSVSDAISALVQIMTDPAASPGARIQAAREVLDRYERFSDRLKSDAKTSRRAGMTWMEKIMDDFDD